VGVWFHYLADEVNSNALVGLKAAEKNIAGHRAFYERFQPDFVKLMSNGYFIYPNEGLQKVNSVQDLKNIRPLGLEHP